MGFFVRSMLVLIIILRVIIIIIPVCVQIPSINCRCRGDWPGRCEPDGEHTLA